MPPTPSAPTAAIFIAPRTRDAQPTNGPGLKRRFSAARAARGRKPGNTPWPSQRNKSVGSMHKTDGRNFGHHAHSLVPHGCTRPSRNSSSPASPAKSHGGTSPSSRILTPSQPHPAPSSEASREQRHKAHHQSQQGAQHRQPLTRAHSQQGHSLQPLTTTHSQQGMSHRAPRLPQLPNSADSPQGTRTRGEEHPVQ